MDEGAQDTALGTTRDELAAYLRHHEARYPRAEQLRVHVDYGDLCDWCAALDAAEAREKALVAALEYYAQDTMIPIPGEEAAWVYRNWYNAVARDALAARAASPAPDGVAGEVRNA